MLGRFDLYDPPRSSSTAISDDSTPSLSLKALFANKQSMISVGFNIPALWRQLTFASLMLPLLICAGCQVPGSTTNYAKNTANPFETGQPVEASEVEKPVIQTVSAEEPSQKTSQADLSSVLDELDEIGDVDPLAREKLTNDLRDVKPELWPLMIQQFKSAMAFRKQLSEEDTELVGATVPHQPDHAQQNKIKASTASHSASSSDNESKPLSNKPMAGAATETPSSAPVIVSDASPAAPTAKMMAYPTTSSEAMTTPPSSTFAANDSAYNAAQPLPTPPTHNPSQAIATAHSDPLIRPATYVSTSPTTTGDWQQHLQQAIGKLESTVSDRPASTAELHEHVQLRMLYLLAGQRGEAMLPVPGATPTMQDYWSKQLFAISTHLDHQQQPDQKRRAASSLIHLDQARAKLAELATLQIRNLSFVDSVSGYGTYEIHESKEFRAGDPVTLYTEVENLRSESTPKGYQASLSTSYEVVDASGQRVDGRQFPDVEDLCQNPRRDFHMQYGVSLPTRIYPGEYQLRLTITDQLSHKIGQATVPFVIVE